MGEKNMAPFGLWVRHQGSPKSGTRGIESVMHCMSVSPQNSHIETLIPNGGYFEVGPQEGNRVMRVETT